jgi:hypothetical protein
MGASRMSPLSHPSLDQHQARMRELRGRPGGPTGSEVEGALNDVYAAVIALEALRTRARRELEAATARALEPAGGERLRDHALTVRRLDADIESLRGVLADLRALPVEPAIPAGATARRQVR